MNRASILLGCLGFTLMAGASVAADRLPGDGKPLLQLQTEAPTAPVTALAFGVVGERAERKLVLYAGGYDKVVRTWLRDEKGRFVPGQRVYRLPIGPGTQGAINALAVSPDGRWLAAAGSGLMREAAGFFDTGIVEPRSGRLSEEMLQDEGTIYLFDTSGRKVRLLRGHRGPVLALAFAPACRGKPPLLVSAARESTRRGSDHACIVRLWDAAKAVELATSPESPDPADGRPGLAIWHTGDEVRELRVALACHGQPLRLWDAAGKGSVKTVGEPRYFNEPAVFSAEDANASEGTLFTTGTPRRWRACLHAWKVSGDRLQADDDREVLLPERSLSYALTLLPTRPGGRIDRAALVQCLREDDDPRHHDYRLVLLRVGRGAAYGRLVADTPLWRGGARPALTTSPDGEWLAASGGPNHEIRLYHADDLARDKPKARQTFRSPGVAFRFAAFVRKGETRGLLLNEKAGRDNPWDGGLIFDVNRRMAMEQRDGWQLDGPDLKTDDWGVFDPPEARKDRHLGSVVRRAGRRIGEVWLQEGQATTAYALLPAGPGQVPLLALAYVEKGVPYLGLWNVQSTQQVRQFTGHLNPIRSLAFDAAGRRLISAAEDQTVCVWSLDDLRETLGRHGMLRGVALRQEGESLRVAEIKPALLNDANREALAAVKEGDLVGGLVIDGKLKTVATPHAFYEAIWKLKPDGARVVVRIAGRDVTLRVDQGIDDHNPLFSLFIARGPERQWVGWNPQGPYDTSDLVRGERYIGWHTNSGDVNNPTIFVEAAKYHKEFYREDILHFLFRRGNLPDARKELQSQRTSPPNIDVSLAGLDPTALRDPSNPPIVQPTELTLQARVTGIDPGRVAKVEWQLWHKEAKGWQPLGQPRPFESTNDFLQVDLGKEKKDWQRGVYEARVAVKIAQDPPVVSTKSVWFHYLPPRSPVAVSDKPRFRLTSPRVIAADAGAEIDITGYLVPANDKESYKVDKVVFNEKQVEYAFHAESGRLKFHNLLRPGRNRLQVFLSNGHSRRTEEAEIYRQRPPRIVSFKAVAAASAGAADLQAVVETAADLPLTETSYRRGAVADQGGEGEWINPSANDWKKTAQGDVETWTLVIKDVPLRAGANGFLFRVANADGPAATARASIEKRDPRLQPQEVILEDLPRGPVAVPRCDVTIRVTSPSSVSDVKLYRNGQEIRHRGLDKPIGREGRTVFIYRLENVPLEPGMNALKVEASNDGGWASSRAANVSYVEPTVEFRLEGYKVRDQEGELLPETTESPDSRVELHGWFRGLASADQSWKRSMRVRVWVNDFEQRDVPLREGRDGLRRFRVPVCLTRERNRVRLRFPEEVKLKHGDGLEFVVRCRKPESRQRLHLLIVAPGEKNMLALNQRVLGMFGAEQRDGNRFRARAFAGGGRCYGPIPYYITADEVVNWLPFIRSTIINSPGDSSDVVLVYFQGQMRSEGGKHYLLTGTDDDKSPLNQRGLDMERLRRNLGDVLGAKILLLDVQGEKTALSSVNDSSLPIGDLRYIWRGEANESRRRRLLDDLDQMLAKTPLWGALRQKLASFRESAELEIHSTNPEGYDDILLKK